MKAISAGILCVLLLLVCACAQKLNDPAEVQAIKKSMDDFEKAVNAGDAGAVAALMTDKTVWADANVPTVVGAKAIQSQWQPFFERFNLKFSGPVVDVRVTGDVGVARGTWTMSATPKVQGEMEFSDRGNWMVTFARQSDASWKWDCLVANSDQPMPGTTADGAEEKALMQIEQEWAKADMKADVEALDKILASGWVDNEDGTMTPKAQSIAKLKGGIRKVESASVSDIRIFVVGDTATVHGLWTESSTERGKDTSAKYRFTDVFVKRDGRWQAVTSHTTKV